MYGVVQVLEWGSGAPGITPYSGFYWSAMSFSIWVTMDGNSSVRCSAAMRMSFLVLWSSKSKLSRWRMFFSFLPVMLCMRRIQEDLSELLYVMPSLLKK